MISDPAGKGRWGWAQAEGQRPTERHRSRKVKRVTAPVISKQHQEKTVIWGTLKSSLPARSLVPEATTNVLSPSPAAFWGGGADTLHEGEPNQQPRKYDFVKAEEAVKVH